MDDRKQVLPLQVIAARFISTDEPTAVAELNRITADAYGLVQRKYWLFLTAFGATLLATALTLLPGILFTLLGVKGAEIVAYIGLVPFALMVGILGYWRILQYGGINATVPQKPVYADPDDPAVRNLECLFAWLQRESTPRAFYFTKGGARRQIDERYFFGSLRAAYVAKGSPIQDALFAPVGFWFAREIFMEADVDDLIVQAKAKPKRGGAKKTYDYTEAVMSLIEHPDIQAMDVGKRGSQTRIVDLLEGWYRTRRVPVPSQNQLRLYAELAIEAIKRNRAASTRTQLPKNDRNQLFR